MACYEKHLNFKNLPKEPYCDGKMISSFKFAPSGENVMSNGGKFNVSSLR